MEIKSVKKVDFLKGLQLLRVFKTLVLENLILKQNHFYYFKNGHDLGGVKGARKGDVLYTGTYNRQIQYLHLLKQVHDCFVLKNIGLL